MFSVTLLNQKGGVGKTSTTHHVGGALALAGHRVLLIDNDPQSSLTQGLLGPDATRAMPAARTVAALYEPDAAPSPHTVIHPSGFDRMDIIPGSRAAQRWNTPNESEWPASQMGIRDFLEDVRDDYDCVLIDCPPNLHLCSWASLIASDGVVVPLQAEDYGAQGLYDITESVVKARAVNPQLALIGFLVTMFDKRLAVHTTYLELLQNLYPGDVFSAQIPRAKDFVESVSARSPIGHLKPKSQAAKSVRAVMEEMLSRINAIHAAGGKEAA